MLRRIIAAILLSATMVACTTIQVTPPDSAKVSIGDVCIERNPKVLVDDFVMVVQSRFAHHGITTDVYEPGRAPTDCNTRLTYTASRSWDLVPFMNHAELSMFQEGRMVGFASYHHHGGFDFSKFSSTSRKMTPIIDELLAGHTPQKRRRVQGEQTP